MDAFALPNKTGDFDEAQTVNVRLLGAGATVYWNLQTQQNAELTLTRNVVFAPTIGWKKGRLVMIEIIQGGAGGYTVAWPSQIKNAAAISIQTTLGSSNTLIFKCIDGGFLDYKSSSTSTRA